MDGRGPIRTCVGCRQRLPQADLIRVALADDGTVVVAGRGHGGRGAYLCPRAECLSTAVKRGALQRALRRRAVVPGPQQLAFSAATLVASRLERTPQSPSASGTRKHLSRLHDELTAAVRQLESR